MAAPLALMLAVQTMLSMATLTVPVLAPVAKAELAVPPGAVGLYTALLYGGAMVSTLIGGALVPRLGAVRASQLCLVLAALAMLATLPMLAVVIAAGALLLGIGYGPATPASSDVLARVTPPAWRGLVFSLKQSGVPLGGALAGLVVPWLVLTVGWPLAGPVVGAACLLLALALEPWRRRLDIPNRLPPTGVPLMALARVLTPIRRALAEPAIARLAWCSFLFAMLQHALGTFLVSHLVASAGLSLGAAGGVLAVAQVSGAVARIVWGAVADRLLAPATMLALLALAMAAGATGTALVDGTTPWGVLIAIAVLFGASAVGWNGVYLAEVARLAPRGAVAEITGGCLAITYLGVMIGPVAFAALVSTTGFATAYVSHAGLALVAVYLLVRR